MNSKASKARPTSSPRSTSPVRADERPLPGGGTWNASNRRPISIMGALLLTVDRWLLRLRLRGADRLVQVLALLATLRAELRELCCVDARPREIAYLDEQFALVFEGAFVFRVELE